MKRELVKRRCKGWNRRAKGRDLALQPVPCGHAPAPGEEYCYLHLPTVLPTVGIDTVRGSEGPPSSKEGPEARPRGWGRAGGGRGVSEGGEGGV